MSKFKNTTLFSNLNFKSVYLKIFIFLCYLVSVLRISTYSNDYVITKINKFENYVRMSPEFLTNEMIPAFNDYHYVVIVSFWLSIFFLIEKISKIQFFENIKIHNKILFISYPPTRTVCNRTTIHIIIYLVYIS